MLFLVDKNRDLRYSLSKMSGRDVSHGFRRPPLPLQNSNVRLSYSLRQEVNVMKKHIIAGLAAFVLIITGASFGYAGGNACGNDAVCREFAALSEAGQYEKIVEKVNPRRSYSAAARDIIGQSYLMVAGREGNTPDQEEQFCLKALEYGASSAYMGLYFIHAGTDVAKALGYLKQYVGTKPQDSVPYVLLGEAAYAQRNYADAKAYLQEAKKVARGRSANVDWLLFQASFLTGDYSLASTMLDSSFAQGKTVGDLKALVSADTRFAEIGKRSEFRKYMNILNGPTTAKNYLKS